MNKIKCVFWLISLTLISSMLSAQVKDSIPAKSNLFSKIKLAKVNLFKKSSKDQKESKAVVDTKNVKKPVAREEKTFEIDCFVFPNGFNNELETNTSKPAFSSFCNKTKMVSHGI